MRAPSTARCNMYVDARSLLQAALRFLQERMHGEGDTMRHLASMGYRLSYEQDPRTEFDFAVSNMSLDLRSGVRLLRAAELLTGVVSSSQFTCGRMLAHADDTCTS